MIKGTKMVISANDVKTKGVSIFDTLLDKFGEVIINVRGKNRYCVIPFEEYEEYRAYKLDKAYNEVIKDIEKGRYHTDMQKHFDSIEEAIYNV